MLKLEPSIIKYIINREEWYSSTMRLHADHNAEQWEEENCLKKE